MNQIPGTLWTCGPHAVCLDLAKCALAQRCLAMDALHEVAIITDVHPVAVEGAAERVDDWFKEAKKPL